ncbi:MAG: winged helix-turn-helix transcriptional regulator [Anaerolineales bacterium]|nr:winged helix-turn-helix transcriptional regulator [Anaerolineales bacterium]
MDEKTFQQAQEWASFYQTISNPHRVLIVWALFERELSVGELAEEIQATLQNTSQHLRLMKDRGFVEARREGQTIYYKIVDHPFFADCAILRHLRKTNHP